MGKFNSAESIRGLACLFVVFSHLVLTFFPYLHNSQSRLEHHELQEYIYNSPFAFWYSGEAAVFIFFVLSGFVLTHTILKSSDINNKLLSMSIKRYPRLALPALFSCIVAWFVFRINIDSSGVSEWLGAYASGSDISFIEALSQGLIKSFIFGYSPINWVLWTMQIELIGSFLLFTILYIYSKNKMFFYIASIIFPLFFIIISPKFVLGMYAFIAGIYIYIYGKNINLLSAIALLIIGLYFAGVHNTSESYAFFNSLLGKASYYILNFLSGILIVYAVLKNKKISNSLDKKQLVYLGKLSFPIYLIHLPLIYLIAVPVFNYLNLEFDFNTSAIIASLVTLIVTLFAAIPVTKYIDAFAINSSNRINDKFLASKLIKNSDINFH